MSKDGKPRSFSKFPHQIYSEKMTQTSIRISNFNSLLDVGNDASVSAFLACFIIELEETLPEDVIVVTVAASDQ